MNSTNFQSLNSGGESRSLSLQSFHRSQSSHGDSTRKDVRKELHERIPSTLVPFLFVGYGLLCIAALPVLLGYILLLHPVVLLIRFLKSKPWLGSCASLESCRSGSLRSCCVCNQPASRMLETGMQKQRWFCLEHYDATFKWRLETSR